MKPRSKLMAPVLAVVLSGALACFAPSAHAEEGGAGGDIKKKIQEKMENILKLMRENEEALLKLSTGKAAPTRKVDVDVPPGGTGSSGDGSKADGASGSDGSSKSGELAGKEMEKLLEDVSKKGGSIPDQLKQLVEMIPL